ncbi:hypothetical protein [Peptoniphilus sp.]|nr:hypothetical protein [Peptoniphilus sp.]MDD7352283.1 hypothetical protein [Peptoniphilaceae bacterium]
MNKTIIKAYDIFKILPDEAQKRVLNYIKALKLTSQQKSKDKIKQ